MGSAVSATACSSWPAVEKKLALMPFLCQGGFFKFEFAGHVGIEGSYPILPVVLLL